MGHIVNARSTRLGVTNVWCDQWYSERIYYPEFLHAMLRIRFYCYYIFTERHFDRKAIFLSHFELYRYFKNVYIEIYYYDGKWETEYEEYKIELFRQHYDMPMNKDPELRRPYFLISSLKFLVLFNWMFYITRREEIDAPIKTRFIKLFRLARVAKFSSYIKNFNKMKNKKFFYWNKVHLHFVLFLLMYVNAKKTIGQTSLWLTPNRNTIFRRLYYIGGCEYEVSYWLRTSARVMGYVFESISKFNKVFLHYYLTNNNCVNAKFLSRYIARKLQQGYPVKVLLNPIRKELLFLIAICSMPISSYFHTVVKKYSHYRSHFDYSRSLYRILIIYLVTVYNTIRLHQLQKEKSYLNMDLLIIFIWFNDLRSNFPDHLIDRRKKNQAINHLLNKYKDRDFLTAFSMDYYKKKIINVCFFENKLLFTNTHYLLYPKLKGSYLPGKIEKFKYFFNWIYEYVFVNKYCLTNDNTKYNNPFIFGVADSLRGLGANVQRFLDFTYQNYNYKSGYDLLGINFLKSRIKIHTRGWYLFGFKMYFRGRFTRKQRAGHMWFSKGKTPLNTIRAHIDYGFYSLSLKNSTISVKIWLYKSGDIENRYYLRMY